MLWWLFMIILDRFGDRIIVRYAKAYLTYGSLPCSGAAVARWPTGYVPGRERRGGLFLSAGHLNARLFSARFPAPRRYFSASSDSRFGGLASLQNDSENFAHPS